MIYEVYSVGVSDGFRLVLQQLGNADASSSTHTDRQSFAERVPVALSGASSSQARGHVKGINTDSSTVHINPFGTANTVLPL